MAKLGQLFADLDPPPSLPDGVFYCTGAVENREFAVVFAALNRVLAAAPPAQTRTKGGGITSAAMTNCGEVGWWSDKTGYRYVANRPGTNQPWPPMPLEFLSVVRRVAAQTPWQDFAPDACLINYYAAGAKMGLHQDKDERDFSQPIITLCLGDDADFMIGGFARGDKAVPLVVRNGDALIMGGTSRMRFHGIRKIYPGTSPLAEIAGRYSLTFRKAL